MDFANEIAKLMKELSPAGIVGTIIVLVVLLVYPLILSGRFRLEWICLGTRHVYRWLRCKTLDRHHYRLTSGLIQESGGGGHFYCPICGKSYYEPW